MSVVGLGWLPQHARAATAPSTDGFNLITSPLPIKLSTSPGRTVTTEIRVKNQGLKAETLKTGLMKFSATGNDGQSNIAELGPKDTYGKWVHFSPAQFVAQPNVWYTVKMTIDVPSNASLGYYLAVTFSRAEQGTKSGTANYRGSIATLVLLNVNTDNEKRSLELVDFSASHGLYEYLPVDFNVTLHNKGNIYIAPSGSLFIQRGNKAVSTVTFNEAGGSVLPNSNRVLKVRWTSGFPVYTQTLVDGKPAYDASGNIKQHIKWDFTQLSKFRIGKYTAKLLVVYDDGKQDVPLESSLSFWVLPWKLLLVGLAIVAVIGFGIFSLSRSVVRGTRSKVVRRRQRHGKR